MVHGDFSVFVRYLASYEFKTFTNLVTRIYIVLDSREVIFDFLRIDMYC